MTAADRPVRHRFTSGPGRVRRRVLAAGLTLAAGAGLAIGVGENGASATSPGAYTHFTGPIGVATACKVAQNSPAGPVWKVNVYGSLTRPTGPDGHITVDTFLDATATVADAQGDQPLNSLHPSATVSVTASRSLPYRIAVYIDTRRIGGFIMTGPTIASLANCNLWAAGS